MVEGRLCFGALGLKSEDIREPLDWKHAGLLKGLAEIEKDVQEAKEEKERLEREAQHNKELQTKLEEAMKKVEELEKEKQEKATRNEMTAKIDKDVEKAKEEKQKLEINFQELIGQLQQVNNKVAELEEKQRQTISQYEKAVKDDASKEKCFGGLCRVHAQGKGSIYLKDLNLGDP